MFLASYCIIKDEDVKVSCLWVGTAEKQFIFVAYKLLPRAP